MLIHGVGDGPVLDATDTWWEGLVISIYGEAFLESVKVFLDSFDILVHPLIRLTVANKVVILEGSRASDVSISGINLFMPRMRNCHELVSEAEVQMTLI